MQMRSTSSGGSAAVSSTRARLPSKRKSLGNSVRKLSTSVVWQLKYSAYWSGVRGLLSMRMVLPLRD